LVVEHQRVGFRTPECVFTRLEPVQPREREPPGLARERCEPPCLPLLYARAFLREIRAADCRRGQRSRCAKSRRDTRHPDCFEEGHNFHPTWQDTVSVTRW